MLYTPFCFEPWAFWWYLWLPYKFNLEVGGSLHIPGAVLSQWGEWGEKLVDGWPSPHPSSGTFGEAFCMLLRRTPPSMEGEPRACSNDLDNAPYVSSSSFPVLSTLLQTTGSWGCFSNQWPAPCLCSRLYFQDPSKPRPIHPLTAGTLYNPLQMVTKHLLVSPWMTGVPIFSAKSLHCWTRQGQKWARGLQGFPWWAQC